MLSIFCFYSAFDEANKVRKPSELCFGHEYKSDFLSNTAARAHVCMWTGNVSELPLCSETSLSFTNWIESPVYIIEGSQRIVLVQIYSASANQSSRLLLSWWAGNYERPFRCALHQIVDFSGKIVAISRTVLHSNATNELSRPQRENQKATG